METLQLSSREIDQRYTKSELSLMAWRSTEIAWQMDTRMKNSGKKKSKSPFTTFDDTKPQTAEDIAAHYREMGLEI